MMTNPRLKIGKRRQSRSSIRAIVIASLFFLTSRETGAQQPAGRPEFEVAAIRASGDCTGGGKPQTGRLTLRCITASALIQMAYGYFADGVSYTPNILHLRGTQGWMNSDHYDITATANGEPSQAIMRGPMLQRLLEDRFHLQFHREKEQGPVFFLTAAKGGIRMPKTADGSCSPVDLTRAGNLEIAALAEPCATETRRQSGRLLSVTVHGISLTNLADGLLSQLAERTVIDRTGLSGLFDFHLEYTPDQNNQPDQSGSGKTVDPDVPSFLTAMQEQSGLKLTRGTGPVPVFIIDHMERPSAN
jgi:uncharacterized protein (TIGR03435 family)